MFDPNLFNSTDVERRSDLLNVYENPIPLDSFPEKSPKKSPFSTSWMGCAALLHREC